MRLMIKQCAVTAHERRKKYRQNSRLRLYGLTFCAALTTEHQHIQALVIVSDSANPESLSGPIATHTDILIIECAD